MRALHTRQNLFAGRLRHREVSPSMLLLPLHCTLPFRSLTLRSALT